MLISLSRHPYPLSTSCEVAPPSVSDTPASAAHGSVSTAPRASGGGHLTRYLIQYKMTRMRRSGVITIIQVETLPPGVTDQIWGRYRWKGSYDLRGVLPDFPT